MLHFCRGITFGMDVGNLFQLQSSFQSHGEIVLSAQEEKTLSLRVLQRDGLDVFIPGENFLDEAGNRLEGANDLEAAPHEE